MRQTLSLSLPLSHPLPLLSHTHRTLYLLGYIPRDNRVYLGDKELNVVSYSLQLSVLEYQTAIMRKDFDTADKVDRKYLIFVGTRQFDVFFLSFSF